MWAPCGILGLASGCPALIKSHFRGAETLPSLFPSSLQTPPEGKERKVVGHGTAPIPENVTSLCPGDLEESPRESNTNALTWPKGSSSVPAPG